MNRIVLAGALAACVVSGVDASAQDGVVFEEDFEDLVLGPSVGEAGNGDVWTNTPPDGWEITFDLPDGGMPEWRGWSFATGTWWTQVAEDQERSKFTNEGAGGLARGVVAIADPDEFDDLGGPLGGNPLYHTWLATPPVDISQAGEDSLVLAFDHSWRPEDTQKAHIDVSFDGGRDVRILELNSVGVTTEWLEPQNKVDEIYIDRDNVNEHVEIEIDNPGGSQEIVVTFGMTDGQNDWWWAIDHVVLYSTALNVDPAGKTATSWGKLKSRR